MAPPTTTLYQRSYQTTNHQQATTCRVILLRYTFFFCFNRERCCRSSFFHDQNTTTVSCLPTHGSGKPFRNLLKEHRLRRSFKCRLSSLRRRKIISWLVWKPQALLIPKKTSLALQIQDVYLTHKLDF